MIFARRAAAQVRHRKAEAVAAGDDDVPILRHCRVQLFDDRPRVESAGSRRIGLGIRFSGVVAIFEAISLLRQPRRLMPCSSSRLTIASAAALASAWT